MTCTGQGFDGLIPDQERDYWLFEPRNYAQLAHMISNQMKNRREQHLTMDLDIDKLVKQYVELL